MSYELPEGEQGQKSVTTVNTSESTILLQISTMNVGEEAHVDGMVIVAGEIYTAASGSHCRSVTISSEVSLDAISTVRERVACDNGHNWFFTKDIFLTVTESD